MGTIANGVPFALYIVSDDLHQSLRAEGNLNPHNGPYYGMSITPEKGQGAKVSRDVSVKRWYTVEFAVDANGLGTATVSDSQGTNVLSKADMPIGLGPFFILLVQREGAPYTVGANEAVWSSVELSPSAVSTASGSAITPSAQPAVISEQQQVARVPAGAAKQDIRSIDFQNFSYESKCLDENAPANLIHVSKGQANNQDGQFWMDKPAYGDFKGDGHELAAVALGCHPADMSPNVNFSEVFIFQMSGSEPKLLATLPPSFWKERRVTGLKVSNQQLAVDFLEMGDRGSNACPEWIVTSKLHWDGNRFVTASESRRKNSCAQ
jgi:hypothetical protein